MSPDQQFAVALTVQFVALIIGLFSVWRKVQDVHVSVNSRMDELLAATAKASRAEGVASWTPPPPVDPSGA